jgi:hypothetical protein
VTFEEAVKLPSWTVIRDGSGTVWEKYGYNWRRSGSSQFYDWTALVYPWQIIWTPVDKGSCARCGRKFYRTRKLGIPYCELTPECAKLYNEEWAKTDHAQGRAGRSWENSSTERKLYKTARARARKNGLPFSVTVDDIFVPEFCPILGIKLEHGAGKVQPASPTLDQIVPGRGYVPGNIQVICHQANTMKSNASLEELQRFAGYYLSQLPPAPFFSAIVSVHVEVVTFLT